MTSIKNDLKKIWYLEMTDINQFLHYQLPKEAFLLKKVIPSPTINRFFYEKVGKSWSWTDRLKWSHEKWDSWVNQKSVNTWILFINIKHAGYFELNNENGDVEIAYFGLLPNFIGKGLGKSFLSSAIHIAWQMTKKRVWVNTCSFDHPNALNNYMSCGFKIFKEVSL